MVHLAVSLHNAVDDPIDILRLRDLHLLSLNIRHTVPPLHGFAQV
ncbi:hypothetical protein SDC9_191381 [bioreactor metagenome]|uniref:Uncharacterized protein n=1 Tax=bioreactor metagenome TaxID=1076179 RepID=A0A645HY74_9ZZZZ